MLLPYIIAYLLLTLLVGFWAARRVKNSGDYLTAGRRIPLFMSSAALFALWFGSETLFGASSEFAQHGLIGIIEDPFGGALCLLLFGLLFSRKLYRMKLLTLGDLYRNRYGQRVELLASVAMLLTFLGYIAAQLVALGLLLEMVTALSLAQGIIISCCIVAAYTLAGGMWAISLTDFVQSILIVIGLGAVLWQLSGDAGGLKTVFERTTPGFFRFIPNPEPHAWLVYLAGWATIGLGSLPSQDIFQRMNASNSEKTAVLSFYIGAFLYLLIATLPLCIALIARQLYPNWLQGEVQQLLPRLVLAHSPFWLQILFFGALISAIFSTCSGAILAPASILTENIIKPLWKHKLQDKHFLLLLRLSVVLIAGSGCWMALQRNNIYALVGESSVLGLVTLLVPMFAALYSKKATPVGAALSMVCGGLVWYFFAYHANSTIPALLPGFGASIAGMWLGNHIKA